MVSSQSPVVSRSGRGFASGAMLLLIFSGLRTKSRGRLVLKSSGDSLRFCGDVFDSIVRYTRSSFVSPRCFCEDVIDSMG